MNVGRARTWPTISMIKNRLRIENAIKEGQRTLRNRRHNTSKTIGSNASDDTSGGSNDEMRFLACRRASMPDGSGLLQEKQWKKEETRRRRFLAQFTDRREVVAGKEIVAQEAEARAYDFDTESDNGSSDTDTS